ncbi:MAG: hypothetical protein ACFFEN_17470 [Candidatus Thorarchaeota archaeon]
MRRINELIILLILIKIGCVFTFYGNVFSQIVDDLKTKIGDNILPPTYKYDVKIIEHLV